MKINFILSEKELVSLNEPFKDVQNCIDSYCRLEEIPANVYREFMASVDLITSVDFLSYLKEVKESSPEELSFTYFAITIKYYDDLYEISISFKEWFFIALMSEYSSCYKKLLPMFLLLASKIKPIISIFQDILTVTKDSASVYEKILENYEETDKKETRLAEIKKAAKEKTEREEREAELINNELPVIYKCECGGAIQQFAFNCDIDGQDLYDCGCPICGKHLILPFSQEEPDININNIIVYVDDIEGYQYAQCLDVLKLTKELKNDKERLIITMRIKCISGTELVRIIKYVKNPGQIKPDGCGYIIGDYPEDIK